VATAGSVNDSAKYAKKAKVHPTCTNWQSETVGGSAEKCCVVFFGMIADFV
jgi:hypothetical protein